MSFDKVINRAKLTWKGKVGHYEMFPWLDTGHLVKEEFSHKETNGGEEGDDGDNVWKLAGSGWAVDDAGLSLGVSLLGLHLPGLARDTTEHDHREELNTISKMVIKRQCNSL